ncbi:T9SS type A sorting domain-containing protein [Flavobacterium piscinae]|uniref:T9SS type A sorting domain-containing protein n=1 Tax=Flavobacterium piscinae TaxID=2506424 RepID=A0A4V1N5F6_9FLAO|nr:choice-of-anchor L domain-containing protein [Flavobacterium piscinae]RXR35496.1 T9SS type A sorting domain-containing protein [Flavobacterium piscinae]
MKTKLLSLTFFLLFFVFGTQAQIQLTACDTEYNGTQTFDLTTVIPGLLGGQNPNDFTTAFYLSQTNAIANVNAIPNPTSYANSTNPQLIWVSFVNNSTSEVTINSFSLQVNPLPSLGTEVATACDDNNDGIATFDFNEAVQIIYQVNNATPNSMLVQFYETQSDMETQSNPIGYTYTNTSPNQIIYIRIENLITGCFWGGEFFLFVENCSTSCETPINLNVTSVFETGAVLSWVNQSSPATLNEIIILPEGSPEPNPSSQGFIINSNPYTITALTCETGYTFYVRTLCENQTATDWSEGFTFTTATCGSTVTPYISVNTTSFSPEQLLKNIILNSSCGVIENVVTQGPCGVGYFNGNDSDFPFEQGMIIRSGQAIFTEGPYNANSLSTTCSQAGDPQLNAIMQLTGQTGTINDVSFVKFDITPTSNILSFNFIFASNEYGQYQCQYSDVFGFILTDLTTNEVTNIAIVPGTTTPVSVTTIRDIIHNVNCPSVNPQFFSTYNVNNPNSSLNMRGYTMPMTAIASVIPNHTYSLKLSVGDYQDTSFDSAVFIEGGSLALGNQCRENIQLITFLDSNNNGIKDAGEPNFLNGNLNYQLNNSGETVSATSHNGVFYIFPENETDTYDFNYSIYSEFAGFYAEPISFEDVVFSQTESNVYYIPIVNTTPYNDVTVSLVATNQPAAGFNYINTIYYTNNGIAPASGTLSFEKDPALTISNISVGGTTNLPTGFTFDYTDLMPSETRSITVTMSVPPIPTVAIGDLATNFVSISSLTTDANPNNNTASQTKPIVASYDPNEKNESHGDKIALADFTEDDYLYYTIRFQNTGTTNATFVRLEDVLDAQLNPESLRMIAASHPYILERISNELIWKFDNIQLVPQIVNENASIGFVHFKIKPNQGIAVGDIIPNTADIYFDFNPVIVTNTFETEFVENLSTPDFTNSTVVLSPNPTKDRLQVQLNGSDTISEISVYDVVGKRVYYKNKLEVNATAVDFSNLHQGVYMVEVITASNQKLVNKVIKQ